MGMATSRAIIIPIVLVALGVLMAWEAWVVAMVGSMGWGLMLLLTGLEMDVDLHLSCAMHVMGLVGEYGVED